MNRALRRLVGAEQDARREKRQRLQSLLRQRMADAAASGTGDASAKEKKPEGDDDVDEDDEVIEQQRLLASASAHWRCVEDSQQAVCIAMNRRQTLLAIGEKDGRVSIWDNTTLRVITKELDPTSIVLPTDADAAKSVSPPTQQPTAEDDEAKEDGDDGEDDALPPAKRAKTDGREEPDGSADGDSATNEEASVDGNDDASVEAEDDDLGAAAMDVDSAEDNLSVDENAGEDQGDEDDAAGGDVADVDSEQPSSLPRRLSEGSTPGLTLDELKIAKSMLKHVVSIAWSCDSRLVFAGCEEKSSRRGRLCVWDAESAWLLTTFSFDGAVNALSGHPTNPDLVIVCSYSSLPVLLNVRTREMTELSVPVVNSTLTVTPPANSRQPSLVVNCRYGVSGRYIYCATSKSTVAILDSSSLECVEVKYLSILVQFVDLAINAQETALAFTSSKGIHEFSIHTAANGASNDQPSLQETRLHATGAVRAPWALCCFSSDGDYVVGMPIVRHRHVGESGLYTWHRATGRVQHNLGVKDGVNSISWDVRRDAIVVVSCAGAIHVLEEEFKTEWPGTMYPAGFRLLTDNELDMEAIERELEEKEGAKPNDDAGSESPAANGDEDLSAREIDVYSMPQQDEECEAILLPVTGELRYIPSIPITQNVKRHYQHDFHIERHFGLGQSVFEPLKSAIKKPSSGSSKKKKKVTTSDAAPKSAPSKSKSKSKSSSSKKRRR